MSESPKITVVAHSTGRRQQLDLIAGDARTLAERLAAAGLPLNMRCGGRGLCSGCEVEVRGASGRIKACQVRTVAAGAEIAVPTRSLLHHAPAVVSEFKINVPWARDPLVPAARLGVAVDIGTTTVALMLCDLATGQTLAEASAFNAQIRHGEDVLTRIQRCATDPAAVALLQRAVVGETINPLLREACARAGVRAADVGAMTVAANTTMLHLLAGVNPTAMGVHPFRAEFLGHRVFAAREFGIELGGGAAEVHLLPGPAAYVGADLAAGAVATGLLYDEGPSLLVDVGTNGEIIAKVGDRLVGCATAAGPAFEGAGLTSGTRAVVGAIERVQLRARPFGAELGLIGGGAEPIGLCGSAYVDFLWEARRTGLLLASGRFDPAFGASAGDPVSADEFGRKLQLHPGGAAGPVWVSEVDIAKLLQAKAAIAAGISTLLVQLGTSAADVKRVHLAGGFGLHLSLEHAIGCGLLPGLAPEQIEVVGNTSLGGAYLALQDRSLLEEMKTVCRSMEVVELNLQPGFEDAYIDNLMLP